MPLIDDNFLKHLEEEIQKSKSINTSLRKNTRTKEKILDLVKKIKDFSRINNYKFDYCLRTCKQFNSSFNKDALKEAKIFFDGNKTIDLKEVINLFEQEKPKENFFYFYVNPEDHLKFKTAGFVKVLREFVGTEN